MNMEMEELLTAIIRDTEEWYGVTGLVYSVSRDGTCWLTIHVKWHRKPLITCVSGLKGWELEFRAIDVVSDINAIKRYAIVS